MCSFEGAAEPEFHDGMRRTASSYMKVRRALRRTIPQRNRPRMRTIKPRPKRVIGGIVVVLTICAA